MKQSEEMLKWGGDNWLLRNKAELGKEDPIMGLLPKDIAPKHRIAEIGCANGWRLKKYHDIYGCEVRGIDPSEAAVAEANIKYKVDVTRGIATMLPWIDEYFDVVIVGYCMWMIEPKEWFRVVAETDRVLKDRGVLIIYDYCAPRAFRSPYNFDAQSHGSGLWTYFFDWARLWLVHPAYKPIADHYSNPRTHQMVNVMRKDMENCLASADGVV